MYSRIFKNNKIKNFRSKKILIFGYGSIGTKHAKVLRNMGIKQIYVYSKQKKIPFKKINNLSFVKKLNPDYVIIASSTSKHFKHLSYVEKVLKNKSILVEKPLFQNLKKLKIKNNKVFVGYNLRFHPALHLIKDKIKNKKIWYASAICGSYLPFWRKNRSYIHSNSAKKKMGGGVLLELSHELDYFLWLFKTFEIRYSFNKKISNLNINTDDTLDLVGKNKKIKYLNIKLNYFFRQPVRQIIIEGAGLSIKADLIKNFVLLMEKNKEKKYFWPNLTASNLYERQHIDVLNKNFKYLCSYQEGIKVMKLINKIKIKPKHN